MIRISSQLALAGLVFAGVAALSMFGNSKATDTAIDEPAFRLTLPGQWSRKPSSDPTRWVYQSDNGEELTVSLLGLKSGMSTDERSKMFKRLAELRKHAESAMPNGLTAVTTTDTTFGESGGILAARYGGTEPAVHRRFICLMLGSTSAFTVFYYEAVGLTQSETDARAKTIMNSVVVPR
jgi:hypothetical protein